MRRRFGKLMTPARERLVIAYWKRRNLHGWRRTRDGGIAYSEWVQGFERFMCGGGLEQTQAVPVVALGRALEDAGEAPAHERVQGADSGRLPQMARVDR